MSVKESRVEQTERIRTELLTAARREFLAGGYHATTLDRIATAAGYTKGVVYSRFASKADLFLALLEERIERRAAASRDLAASLTGVEGLVELVRRWSEVERDDEAWSMLVVEFRAHASRDPELNARYAVLHTRTIEGVARAIELVLGPDVDPILPRLVMATGLGSTLERVVHPDAISREGLDRVVRALVGAFQ